MTSATSFVRRYRGNVVDERNPRSGIQSYATRTRAEPKRAPLTGILGPTCPSFDCGGRESFAVVRLRSPRDARPSAPLSDALRPVVYELPKARSLLISNQLDIVASQGRNRTRAVLVNPSGTGNRCQFFLCRAGCK